MIHELIDEPYWHELEKHLEEILSENPRLYISEAYLPIFYKDLNDAAAKSFMEFFIRHGGQMAVNKISHSWHEESLGIEFKELIPIILEIDKIFLKEEMLSALLDEFSKDIKENSKQHEVFKDEQNLENLFQLLVSNKSYLKG